MYWGLVCLYTGSHIFNPPGDQQMSSRKELLYLLEQFIPAGILFAHYMPPQLNRNRLQVCSAMNMCILCLMYSFIYLFVVFFLIFGHAILCRQTHLGFHPITRLIYTQEQGDVLLSYLHKCPNIHV